MDQYVGNWVQRVSVRVTVGDFGESFWVEPLPDQVNVGRVCNALMNGAVSFGDVVEWDGDGNVMAVRSRSDRVTIVCWVETDDDDLATRAKWMQTCRDAHTAWTDAGVVVEGGFGGVLIAAFVMRPRERLMEQCENLLKGLHNHAWELLWTICSHPGTPLDPAALGLAVPPPFDEAHWEEEPALGLPDISENLLADNAARDLIGRLRALGHIHAGVKDDEVLGEALSLLETDARCYRSCQAGKNDQVLVLAGHIVCFKSGLMAPEYDPVQYFTTDFLAG